MAVLSRVNSNLLLAIASVSLALSGLSYADDDMWSSVFTYQQKMADYGKAEAQVKLGEMYEEGHGTEQDFDMAEKWYRTALKQGYTPAKEKLEKLQQHRDQAAAAKADKARKKKDQERAEQQRKEQDKLEQERKRREEAERERAEMERRAKDAERKLKEERAKAKKEKAAEQQRKAEEKEAEAKKRAEEAMKQMMSTPDAYIDE